MNVFYASDNTYDETYDEILHMKKPLNLKHGMIHCT